MKQLITKNKILGLLAIIIIIAGAIVVGIKGFNFDLNNDTTQTVELYIENEFDVSDIKNITNDVFGSNKVLIQKVEVYEDSVQITAKEITDEQKNNLVQKINEKYNLELKAEDITIKDVPHINLKEIVKPYILPLIVATIIILIYIGIRYHKLGVLKSILKTGGIAVIAQLVLFSLIAITRFPVGRYTLPLVLFVYLISMIGITSHLEKKLKEKKEEEKNETEKI